MQPLIGPPIPIHVLATTSGPMQVVALALVVASLAVHVYFLVWCFLFLQQWGREIDERTRRIDEEERKWREGHRDLDDPVLKLRAATEQIRETLDRMRDAGTA